MSNITLYVIGMHQALPILEHKEIKAWMQRVKKHLAKNPLLMENECIVNPLP